MDTRPAIDKVVLIHRSALTAKYRAVGVAKIDAALKAMVRADAGRGIATKVVAVDSAAELSDFGAAPAAVKDPKAVKAVIDAIDAKLAPHYFLLIGAGDVMPLAPLRNPAYHPKADDDKTVPSDLPYACDAPYSTDPGSFMGATRVVGRVPDEPGATQPTLLTRLIRHAAAAKPAPAADYTRYFGLTAEIWQKSTALSLRNVFGSDAALLRAPVGGPKWSATQLAPKLHFINCHGADLSPEYYGQPASGAQEYPVSHRASLLPGKLQPGSVLAAECCYGAQLFDPAHAGGHHGIALTYLTHGALGVFGSTTIAYGPSEGNGSADLITQYFLLSLLDGASLGRAALEARQRFAGQRTHLDPYDLKTLAQFYLLGDPSVQPVAIEAHALNRTATFKKAFAKTADRGVRGLRREKLKREGLHLQSALPRLKAKAPPPGEAVARLLGSMAEGSGLAGRPVASFDIVPRRRAQGGVAPSSRRSIHVVAGRVATAAGAENLQEADNPTRRGPPGVVAVIATEQDGQLLHVRRLHSR